MKIGDRIYVRGYIDEIRKDTVIVRNDGGYFGTILSEVTGELPSAQSERDTPRKPTETTDRTWGIPHRQAVCPNCDRYLGTIHFICEGDKRKVSYCESCGQAIDWEGWEQDE